MEDVSIEQVVEFIRKAQQGDLKHIREAYRNRVDFMARYKAQGFLPGDKVWFRTKVGFRIEGYVEKVNQKNLKVRQTNDAGRHIKGTLWTAAASVVNLAVAPVEG